MSWLACAVVFLMHLKAILYATLCAFAGGIPHAQGQAKASVAFSDPDEIRLLVPTAATQAAHHALTATERASLCHRGRGFIQFTCQVNGNGHIAAITNVQLFQAAQTVPASIVTKLKSSIRRDVVFYVPAVTRPPKMARWRRPSIVLPLALFCP